MEIEEKIYKLGINVLDELLLHRNISKSITVSIEDSNGLRNMTVHVEPHVIFTFNESEIADFYQIWSKMVEECQI